MKKAIPTEYKGIEFKSRFEANFAALLDAMAVKWEYEPKSFLLPSGMHYMPDFWVPDHQLWIECRGYSTEKGEAQIAEFGHLAMEMCLATDGSLRETPRDPDPDVYVTHPHSHYMVVRSDAPAEFYESCRWLCEGLKSSALLAMCALCGSPYFMGEEGTWICRGCGRGDKRYHLQGAWDLLGQVGRLVLADQGRLDDARSSVETARRVYATFRKCWTLKALNPTERVLDDFRSIVLSGFGVTV